MNKREKDKVLIRFYEVTSNYESLAQEFHRILDNDHRFPHSAVYTVKHRIKDSQRLIEKIEYENENARKSVKPITHENFTRRISDLLGVRIVVLRLSDVDKVKDYLDMLVEEKRLKIVGKPTEKKTFLLRAGEIDLDKPADAVTDIQYSGYSSIHYKIKLGDGVLAPPHLSTLTAELQLRTILEEAWGEIDHQYRYELIRSGNNVPNHLETGFRDLSFYLQAAARQVEHLCEEAESLASPRKVEKKARARTKKRKSSVTKVSASTESIITLTEKKLAKSWLDIFADRLGIVPERSTISYLQRRLGEHDHHTGQLIGPEEFSSMMSDDVLARFRALYRYTKGSDPFESTSTYERDGDIVLFINFAIFSTVQSKELAEAGLRATIRKRLPQSGY